MIRVLLVDDQKSIRETLKSILEAAADFDIVGMADNGFDAIELVQQLKPDVVLMDMEMPDIDGAIATKIISQSVLGEQVKVLVVSSYDSGDYVTKSIQAGAKGYLLKGASAEKIRGAIRSVHQGYTQIASGLFEQIVPETPVAAGRAKRPILVETDVQGLALTGFKIKEKTPVEPLPVTENIEASEMLIDVVPIRVRSRSRRWRKLPITITVLLGLLGGGSYLLYKRLRQPALPMVVAEQSPPLLPVPFVGTVEPAQLAPIDAQAAGMVQDIKVKVGQPVQIGESLLVIRNIDPDQANLEQSPQQKIIQQQQSSQQRITSLQTAVNTDRQNLAVLRNKIAASRSPSAAAQNPNQSALVKQQQTIVQKNKSVYQRQSSEYQRKQKVFEEQKNLAEKNGLAIDRLERFMTEADRARVEMEYARSNYEHAQLALQEARQLPADIPPSEPAGMSVQQQLDREEKLNKLEEQLRQEQLSYKQLSNDLQVLRQQIETAPTSAAGNATATQPAFIDVIASQSGYVVEILVKDGERIATGAKLMKIANNRQLKVALEFDGPLPPFLQLGKNSTVQVRNGQDLQEFEGKIIAINPVANKQKYKVEVGFPAAQDFLLGQSATIYFPERAN
jgi:hemolysin D